MEHVAGHLFTRARCGYYRGRYYRCSGTSTRWSHWGRWVLAGASFLLFILAILLLCIIARRRRKRGTKPYYGTGWMAPNGKSGINNNTRQPNNYNGGTSESHYYSSPNQNAAGYNAPPAYGAHNPQYTGTTFNSNDGYYGNNQYNSGMQPPPNAYQPHK